MTAIYFIQNGDGAIKIGRTDGSLNERVAQLTKASGRALKLIGAVEAEASLERELHERFAEVRLVGEWFSPSRELLDAIDSLLASLPKATEKRRIKAYDDPWTALAGKWLGTMAQEVGIDGVKRATGLSGGTIENIRRVRVCITVRDFEAIRKAYLQYLEQRLVSVNEMIARFKS